MKNEIVSRFWLLWLLLSLPMATLCALSVGFAGGVWDARGWMAALMLLWPAFYLLGIFWQWADGGKRLAFLLGLAFLLRLILGFFFYQMLPQWGYENAAHQVGYLFADAFTRDSEAWNLASSNQPLWAAFQGEYGADQYGGLMFLSSTVYRFLSPDAHRPLLMIILSAFAGAAALPFFWKALRSRWGDGFAFGATWIMALYPETILLGSSQMREPFLIAFFCIALERIINWTKDQQFKILLVAGFSLLAMALVSWRVAVVAFGSLFVWLILDRAGERWAQRWRVGLWAGMGIAMVAFFALSWIWFRDSASWDAILLEQGSGMVQYILSVIGEDYRLVFTSLYGVLQPVLPATLVDSSIPLASAIVIMRALGWWLLAPLFLYGCVFVWKAQTEVEKRTLVWIAGFSIIWILASSLRAGGDLWDNPRYRAIFLPWLALLSAWGWDYARKWKDAWLGRFGLMEGMLAVVILLWYLTRQSSFRHYGIISHIGASVILLLVMLIVFMLYDWIKRKEKKIS